MNDGVANHAPQDFMSAVWHNLSTFRPTSRQANPLHQLQRGLPNQDESPGPAPITAQPSSPPVLELAVPEKPERREIPSTHPSIVRQTKPARKSLLLPLVLGDGLLAVLLVLLTGVAGIAALMYFRANAPAIAVSETLTESKVIPRVVVAPAKDLEELKAATVFIKVTAGSLRGSGSGFLIKSEATTGYIATNHHVVAPVRGFRPRFDSAEVTVVFRSGTSDEQSYRAMVVADEPDNDLAVLKVTQVAMMPKPVDLSAANLVETLPVTVYGFPFGAKLGVNAHNPSITVSKGSVSSLHRNGRNEVVAVQIDGR